MPGIFYTMALSNTTSPSPTTKLDIDHVSERVGYFAGLIDKYGPVVVVLGVFLVIFVLVLLLMIRNNRALVDRISASQASYDTNSQKLVEKVVDACMAKLSESPQMQPSVQEQPKEEDPPLMSVYINANLAFKDASRIAMSKVKCQRIAIYLFHNGNHTPYGYPFAKMSCVHEWTMRGSDTVRGRNHVDVPLYAFSNIIDSLIKDGEFVVGNIYDHGIINTDEQTFQFISGSTIKALYALPITDPDGCLAAFTVAEFKDQQDFMDNEPLYENVRDALKTMNDNIYSIVINEDFKKKYSGES